MSDQTCSCNARIAGECCCGAWDEDDHERDDEIAALKLALVEMTAARDEACHLAVYLAVKGPGYSQACADEVDRLRAVGKKAT